MLYFQNHKAVEIQTPFLKGTHIISHTSEYRVATVIRKEPEKKKKKKERSLVQTYLLMLESLEEEGGN